VTEKILGKGWQGSTMTKVARALEFGRVAREGNWEGNSLHYIEKHWGREAGRARGVGKARSYEARD